MTNRQSNIIFYGIISLIVYALIINYTNPDFFEDFAKSEKELAVKEAVKNGENSQALSIYQQLIDERISEDKEKTVETAAIYEEMAKLYLLVGNKSEEKTYYLKSLNIKEKLEKNDVIGFAKTYDKLGAIAEAEGQYDQAQMYFEKSLSKKLGNTEEQDDEGMFVGMQNTRERYLRLNNEATIDTFKKLAEIHTIKKELAIAKHYYERALTASKLTFGEDDFKTLEIMKLMNSI